MKKSSVSDRMKQISTTPDTLQARAGPVHADEGLPGHGKEPNTRMADMPNSQPVTPQRVCVRPHSSHVGREGKQCVCMHQTKGGGYGLRVEHRPCNTEAVCDSRPLTPQLSSDSANSGAGGTRHYQQKPYRTVRWSTQQRGLNQTVKLYL